VDVNEHMLAEALEAIRKSDHLIANVTMA